MIRLRRVGNLNNPHYRIVAADERSPRDGRFIETLGSYHPRAKTDEEKVSVDVERVKYWLGVGAQVSEAVRPLLRKKGVVLPTRRRGSKKVAAQAEATEAAPGVSTSQGEGASGA